MMAETTTEVRADIEQTKARMSGAIAELERKVDVTQKVRDHPWAAVGLAFGAGIALSASHADVKAAKAAQQQTRRHRARQRRRARGPTPTSAHCEHLLLRPPC